MPMRRNEAETAAHGCHYLGDTAVRMPDRGLVFERVTCFNRSKSYLCCRLRRMCVRSQNKNRMTHPLRVAKNCTHPLPRVQKLMTHPLSAPAHPRPPPPPPPPTLLWFFILKYLALTCGSEGRENTLTRNSSSEELN